MVDTVIEDGGPCAAELAVMDEFLDALQAGNAPEVEAFLKRHPLYAESLRPVLEGAVLMDREVRKLRRWHVPIDGLGKG
jgi:hypothetical protein